MASSTTTTNGTNPPVVDGITKTTTAAPSYMTHFSYGSSTDGDNNNERTSFLSKQSNDTMKDYNDSSNERKYSLLPKLCFLLVGCIVGMIIASIGSKLYERIEYPIQPIQRFDIPGDPTRQSQQQQQNPPVIRIRPVCTYYYGTTSSSSSSQKGPQIIQTSMDEPSQPWSTVECYPVAPSSSSNRVANKVINAFGVPDALLKVNYNRQPFRGNPPILGFGGAFTEASALNFKSLSQAGQETVLELLFGKTGLGYSIGRFPINSCDFSVESYNFDATVDDFDLQYFDMNVTHDTGLMTDFALRALNIYNEAWTTPTNDATATTTTADNDEDSDDTAHTASTTITTSNSDPYEKFHFFASPWSPPGWMKYPTWEDAAGATYASKMTYSAQPVCLKDGVSPTSKYAAAWALYFSKFITAYKNHGIPLWAVTVQNEPEFPAPWEACSYSPQNESEFVAYHLGPQLQKDHPDLLILGFDHNKDHVTTWADTLLNTTKATEENYASAVEYVDGIAYHWYAGGMDRLLDGAIGTANLHRLQSNIQDLNLSKTPIIFNSEGCHCPTTGYAGGEINNYWARAERYAHTILGDLMAGSQGWVEWNFLLDSIGGPNHLGNLCDTPLLAVPHRAINATFHNPLPPFEHTKPMGDGKTIIGDDRTLEELNAYGFNAKYIKNDGVVVQPLYYYMGHISRYVRPGSRAVTGLVNQNSPYGTSGAGRIFRSSDSVVAGGGINDLARNGIEITVWPCEGSTRQHFVWDNNIKSKDMSMYKRIQVPGHDWLGNPTKACFPRSNNIDLLGITLTDCTAKTAGMYDVVKIENDSFERYYIKLLNPIKTTVTSTTPTELQCLYIIELENNGGGYGPRGGAQVAIGDCSHESAKWILDIENGTASSLYFSPPINDTTGDSTNNTTTTSATTTDATVCMTTGWPFLQLGAFLREIVPISNNTSSLTSTDNSTSVSDDSSSSKATAADNDVVVEKTIVILNEARESANYILVDENDDTMLLSGSIPPRSIQTIVL